MSFDQPEAFSFGLRDHIQSGLLIGYACENFDYHISECSMVSSDVLEKLDVLFCQGSPQLAAILQIKIIRGFSDILTVQAQFNRMEFPVSASTIVHSSSLYHIPAIRERWASGTTP